MISKFARKVLNGKRRSKYHSAVGGIMSGAILRKLKKRSGGKIKSNVWKKTRVDNQQRVGSGGSNTRYVQKRKCDYLENTQHNDISHTSFQMSLAKPKKFFKSLGDFQYLESYQSRLTNLEGFQGSQNLRTFFTASAFITTNATRNINNNFPQLPFDLNPFQTNTGGVVIPSIVAPAPDYIHCKTIDSMLLIQNTSNVPQSVELNWFMCRKTSSLDPIAAWQFSMDQKRLGQAAAGVVTSTGLPNNFAGYTNVSQYGQSPFSEKTFNKLWGTLKRISFDLQPGGQRKFLYKIHVNRTYSRAEQQQYVTQGTPYVSGQTIVPVVITRPGMATIQDTASPTEATIAQASVATIITNHYTWSSVGGARLEYDRTFQGIVQGTPSGHTLKPENVVGDLDTQVAVLNL